MPRTATIDRKTGETQISLKLDLDGAGKSQVDTGIKMLDHMVSQLARHGNFDLTLTAKAGMDPDGHHTVEDVAIALGQAFNQALGDKKGIVRMAHAIVPLDEALAMVVVDISGRGYAVIDAPFEHPKIADLVADLARHFLSTLAVEGRMNIHVKLLAGINDHHKLECIFKALARSLGQATRIDPRIAGEVPSTKGMLER